MSDRRIPTPQANYLPLIEAESRRRGVRVGVREVIVRHDDWCDVFNGHCFCNCAPVVTFKDARDESRTH